MGAPGSGMEAAAQPGAEALLDAFKTIDPAERQKHEAVLAYWLSIRGSRELPPLRDLDPLEISDAAPFSALLELIGGGEDADIRHLGEALKFGGEIERISEAPRPSILSSIARKLSIVAISRNFLAFEDEFEANGAGTRCWVTLLPLSSAGAWVDYVYAFVSFGAADVANVAEQPVEDAAALDEVASEPEPQAIAPDEEVLELDSPVEPAGEAVEQAGLAATPEPSPPPPAKEVPGFSFDAGAVSGFYATKAVKVKPTLPEVVPVKPKAAPVNEAPLEPVSMPATQEDVPAATQPSAPAPEDFDEPEEISIEEPVSEPVEEEPAVAVADEPQPTIPALEGTLESKLTDVRAKADEARQAKLRANAALYEGLGAAYDFALDAEQAPEEYLKLVEAQGMKIQLRAPMRPVVKLAFEGMCDDSTIAQLEAVLAWAIDQELPRGTLAERIEEQGGIGPILNGQARAA